MTVRLIIATALLTSVAVPAAAAANQVVVRASGPSANAYPIGRKMLPGSKVRLDLGDRLTLLGPSRATVLSGPGIFTVAAVDDGAPFRRTRLSARRGPPMPRGPWAVDVQQTGKVCFTPKEKLSLWRSAADSGSTVTISGEGIKPLALQWPAETQALHWPAELPLQDGATYSIRVPGSVQSEWTIAAIGSWSLDYAAAAEALLQHGCKQQLDQLLEQVLWEQ